MKNLYPFLLILTLASGVSLFAQSDARQSPQLIDFGASLRPGYVKPKPSPRESKPGEAETDEVIRIDIDLVVTDVLVLNEKGIAAGGLTKDDFMISEDKTAQTIDAFSQGDGGQVPRSIVLIIDYSGSLLPFIGTSVAAAKVLVDKLKPQDRMAIVTDDVELLIGFTRDRQLLKDKLNTLENNTANGKLGKSRQYSALMATLNELFDEEDVRPIVIFQTDADEFGALKGNYVPRPKEFAPQIPPPVEVIERPFSYQDIITATEKARATIYTIIPGTQYLGLPADEQIRRAKTDSVTRMQLGAKRRELPETPLPEETLERLALVYARKMLSIHQPIVSLAKSSGGWANQLETPEQANAVYSRVLTNINNRYLIGY